MTRKPLKKYSAVLSAILGLLVLGAASPTLADGNSGDVVSIQFENDLFGGNSDRHFTHGSRVTWLPAQSRWTNQNIRELAEAFPLYSKGRTTRVTHSIGQNIYTPEDISNPALIKDDRPYAGWTYVNAGVVSRTRDTFNTFSLDLGIIGPPSGAEFVQTEWHRIFGLTKPRGWDHQLKTEPGIVLSFEHKRRWRERLLSEDVGMEITPHYGVNLGNVFTHAAAGLTVRIGTGLVKDWGVPRIRPSLPGSSFFKPSNDGRWYLFAGIEGRVVARNIFLDGNTFASSHRVNRKPIVADFQFGAALTYKNWRVAYTQIMRSREFDGQQTPDVFGSFNVTRLF